MPKSRFVTVGLGPVGRALTVALTEAGYKPILLVGRGRKVERNLARKIGARLTVELTEDINNIDFVLITLPTSKLAEFAKGLANQSLPWRKLTFIHASGSLGISPFQPLAELGSGVASMHPYQTFPKKQSVVNLNGITYGITGNRKGAALARQIARDLDGRPIMVDENDRMLYHLSAIIACTFVTSNVETAIRVLKALGIKEQKAIQVVLPIVEETIRNIKELGLRAAMTGPQTRGDTALIRRHVTELRKRLPEGANIYDATSRFIMETRADSRKK